MDLYKGNGSFWAPYDAVVVEIYQGMGVSGHLMIGWWWGYTGGSSSFWAPYDGGGGRYIREAEFSGHRMAGLAQF